MATSATSVASPSAFATLLRRSKFASFDPKINQAYTAPTAHRVRGQWGMKRQTSLQANAPKPQYMSVPAADTYYNQMVWKSAENNVRYVKQQEELGYVLDMDIHGDSVLKDRAAAAGLPSGYSPVDSDFQSDSSESRRIPYAAPPPPNSPGRAMQGLNILKMNAKQFERYVEELRKHRGKLREYILRKQALSGSRQAKSRGLARVRSVQPSHAGDTAIDDGDFFLEFGTETNSFHVPGEYLKHFPPGDNHARLTSFPHPTGGLYYHTLPPLQAYLMSDLLPGHRLGNDRQREGSDYVVDIGTHVGRVPMIQSEGASATETMMNDMDRTKPRYRVWRASIKKVPEVVDAREDVNVTRMRLMLRVSADADADRANPNRPGSAEWVDNVPPSHKKPEHPWSHGNKLLHPYLAARQSITKTRPQILSARPEQNHKQVLGLLHSLLTAEQVHAKARERAVSENDGSIEDGDGDGTPENK